MIKKSIELLLKTLKYHKFFIKHLFFSINCDKWDSNHEKI